jgi:hypothetical protein
MIIALHKGTGDAGWLGNDLKISETFKHLFPHYADLHVGSANTDATVHAKALPKKRPSNRL